jgi:Tfp pilus assembly protein PilX
MPITPTQTVDPATMTKNWSSGMNATNAQKLIAKYNAPKRAFNADPQGAQAAWTSGIQRAMTANKYASGMQNANLNQASANMTNYGGNNWVQSGTSKSYKYAAKSQNLAAAINSVLQTVNAMPKGRGANNIARMTAWANGMAQFYGKI